MAGELPEVGVMHAAVDSSVAFRELRYLQAVLWINPLMLTIQKANNQLSSLRILNEAEE